METGSRSQVKRGQERVWQGEGGEEKWANTLPWRVGKNAFICG